MKYLHGLGNYLQSEAMAGVIVAGRNSPQKVSYGLYTEQLSGSAFTAPRSQNRRSWLYRIRPSVMHGEFKPLAQQHFSAPSDSWGPTPPTQMRWDPLPYAAEPHDFIQGIVTLAGHGNVNLLTGAAIHLYAATASMESYYFYNADGELLIVPFEGGLRFKTELGIMDIHPGEIAVIPRGIKFQASLLDGKARGYICENFGSPFCLPDLGVIGANGLANPRDFKIPAAAYENKEGDFALVTKFQGHLWAAKIAHSPCDVVAWHGNYFPYKYDLTKFNTINTVSFDHPDPSIFTVLTSPSYKPGVANVDFVIFPPRWMVASDTFRLPYYHRNIMNEYMGLISGVYDAKEMGFIPGGGSLHNCMSAHGPDAEAFEKAVNSALHPEYYNHTLAFMFEAEQVWQLSPYAQTAPFRQKNYLDCWQGLSANFDETALI